MACGKLVITDRLPDSTRINELFVEGEDIIYYDNLIDCINKINYYHENEEERNRIASNGRRKVLEHYTQVQVVNQLEEVYEKNRHN
jgi:spore maturation protein CgeB